MDSNFSEIMTILSRIDWTAWFTLMAVLTALYPIYREHLRSKAHARNLRIRFGAALTKLRPSLVSLFKLNENGRHAVLKKEEFKNIVRDIEMLFAQATVLESDELDQLGVTFLNLHLTAAIYETPSLGKESAESNVYLIDKTIEIMASHGLISTKVSKPWESQQDGSSE